MTARLGSHRTRRWRKSDSNPRSRVIDNPFSQRPSLSPLPPSADAPRRTAVGLVVLLPNPPPRDQWFADSLLEGSGFELVWGFSCQAVVWVVLTVFCSERERPFFVPSPGIRFAERAEGVKGPKR